MFDEIYGAMQVKKGKETLKLVLALEKCNKEMFVGVENHVAGTAVVTVECFDFCDDDMAKSIVNCLQAFAPYLVGESAVCFETRYNGEVGRVWVGERKKEIDAERAILVQEARNAIEKLTTEEWEKLYEEITGNPYV